MEFFYFTRAVPVEEEDVVAVGEEIPAKGGAHYRREQRGRGVFYGGRDFDRLVAAAVDEALMPRPAPARSPGVLPPLLARDDATIMDLAALRILGGLPILGLASNATARRLAAAALHRYEPAEIEGFLASVPPWAAVDDDEEALAVLLLS